ncbi:MAG: hypothetical protein ACREB3_14695 [Burkholderiales bacterium]
MDRGAHAAAQVNQFPANLFFGDISRNWRSTRGLQLGIELFRVGGTPERFSRIGKLIVGAQGNAHPGSRLP